MSAGQGQGRCSGNDCWMKEREMPAPSDAEVRGRSLCKNCHRWDCQQGPLQTRLETEGSSVPPRGSCTLHSAQLSWGEGYPSPQIHTHPEPQQVTLLGNGASADAIS